MAVCPNGHDSASDDFCDVCGIRIAGPPGTSAGPAPPASPASPAPSATQAAAVGEPCPRCGTARSGQFCEACGYNFNIAQPSWSAAPSPPGPAVSSASSAPSMPAVPAAPSMPAVPAAPSMPAVPAAPSMPAVPAAPSMPAASSASSAWSEPSAPSVPTTPPVRSAPSVAPTRAVPRPSHAVPAVWTAVVSSDRDHYERVRAAGGPDGAEVPFPAYYAERRFQLVGGQMRIGRRSVSRGLDPEIDLTGPPADPGISRLHAVLIAAPDGTWSVLDPGSVNGTFVNGNDVPTGTQVPLHDGDRINLGAWTAITVHRG
jgi:hypothetical protein